MEVKEEEHSNGEIKEEQKDEDISVNVTVKLKSQESELLQDDNLEDGINLYHDVPALHNSVRECKNYRASLFTAHNRFKRALSARTDLSLRLVSYQLVTHTIRHNYFFGLKK